MHPQKPTEQPQACLKRGFSTPHRTDEGRAEHQDRQLAYIGESEGVGGRLSYHNSNETGRDAKSFWTDTVVLISKDENLTKSHARYVESSLIRNIGSSIRWSIPNSKKPSDDAGKLPLQDRVRGEYSIAELCRREGIAESLYYSWSKEFLEAGKKRLAGDTARSATSSEVKDLRREVRDMKVLVADCPSSDNLRQLGA